MEQWTTVTAMGRTVSINVVGKSEGGRMGHCDASMGACHTLAACWGHDQREGWSPVA